MPILVPAVSCHPTDLLTCLPDDVKGRRWLVACTMPRQEKSLARELHQRGVPFYLPLLAKRLLYKRRTAKSYLPLFSGFVFLYANDAERAAALETGRITSILEVPNQAELHRDLSQVESMLRQSDQLADGRATAHNGCSHREDKSPVVAGSNGSNGNHSPHSMEQRLVLSVGFLRQNILLETNSGVHDGAQKQTAAAGDRKRMSL